VADDDLARVALEVAEVEGQGLLPAEAGGVEELDERAVARARGRRGRGARGPEEAAASSSVRTSPTVRLGQRGCSRRAAGSSRSSPSAWRNRKNLRTAEVVFATPRALMTFPDALVWPVKRPDWKARRSPTVTSRGGPWSSRLRRRWVSRSLAPSTVRRAKRAARRWSR